MLMVKNNTKLPEKITPGMLYLQQQKMNKRLGILVGLAIAWSIVLIAIPVIIALGILGVIGRMDKAIDSIENRVKAETDSIVDDVRAGVEGKLEEVKDSLREEFKSSSANIK